jgi:MIP family channel proteins
MRDSLRHFAAEFIGVFALVFLGGAANIMLRGPGSLVTTALAHGFILAAMVTATMRVSGHLNPAVTIGFLVTRRIQPTMGALYLVAQVIGAMVGAYALQAVIPDELFAATRGGGQAIALDVSTGQAFLIEMLATFFLVFVVFGTAVDPQSPKVGGLAIGLVVAADILAVGPLTGASMNPARSLGPAVASGIFEGQAIYWLGPIVGGVVAAVLYDQLFLPRAPEIPGSGAVQPDKVGAPRIHPV